MCVGCSEWMNCYIHQTMENVYLEGGAILTCADQMRLFHIFEEIALHRKDWKEKMKERNHELD